MSSFFRLLGRTLFVLIIIVTGYERLTHPQNFTPVLAAKYQNFESFLKKYQLTLPAQISFQNLQKNVEFVNRLLGYESILVGLGVCAYLPFFPILLTGHIFVYTLVLNNPFYYKIQSNDFFRELGQCILSLALLGISMLLWMASKEKKAKVGAEVEEEAEVKEKKEENKEGKEEKRKGGKNKSKGKRE